MLKRTTPMLALLAAPAALLAAPGLQAPHAPWQTIQTAHYQIHYPPMLADWAQDVAGRIEGIHAQVTAMVGYESPELIQVLLVDPMQEANGMALPLLTTPRVVLWRPEPLSDNLHGGAMTSWTELLVTHELTHIHHLTRPTRPANVFTSLFGLPLGPLVLKAPRWIMEGYATLVEGRLTGSGRPHSAIRAMLLRQWALAGKLPAYEELNGGDGYLAGNMAYMVGSAYLEWLERQRPQGKVLQQLWKQLASRKGRKFEAAFLATFAFTPQDGYQRFQAETTHDALEWETSLKAQGLRQGELWLRATDGVTDLGVSPDGKRLLARVQRPDQAGLRICDLTPAPAKPARKKPKPVDPLNEVMDAPPEWTAPKVLAKLPALNGQQPHQAQWAVDGSVLFQLKHPDSEGRLHRAPAQWQAPGAVDQHPAAPPAPYWQLLQPRHHQGRWQLELDGQIVPLPGQPAGRAVVDASRQQVFAACELDGIWNLVRVPYTGAGATLRFAPAERLTRTVAAAWNPAPTPDGHWLYFTSLDARGMEIRRLDLTLPPLATAEAPAARILNPATVMPPAAEPSALPAPVPPPAAQPYRAMANLNHQVASGATFTPAGNAWQLGASGEDLLGHLSWQALAGFSSGAGPRGAALGISSTAWRWQPSLQLFSAQEHPSRQGKLPVQRDQERRGVEFALERDILGAPWFWTSPVLAWEQRQSLAPGQSGPWLSRSLAGLRSGLQALWGRGPWLLTARPTLDLYSGSTDTGSGRQTWSATRAALQVSLDNPFTRVTFLGEQGRFGGTAGERFHLGGITTSLVPQSLDLGRVQQLALPAYSAEGNRFLRYRGEVGDLVKVYLEGHALWDANQERQAFQRVLGVELVLDLPSPGGRQVLNKARIELGVHRPLDGVTKGSTVGTLSLVVRP